MTIAALVLKLGQPRFLSMSQRSGGSTIEHYWWRCGCKADDDSAIVNTHWCSTHRPERRKRNLGNVPERRSS